MKRREKMFENKENEVKMKEKEGMNKKGTLL
jgi:hypothetical protein